MQANIFARGIRLSIPSLAWLSLLLLISIPAFATSQCPPELGPKSASVNAFGWLLVFGGVALGCGLLGYAIKRSRGTGLFKRSAIIVLATAALALLSLSCLELAMALFFMQC